MPWPPISKCLQLLLDTRLTRVRILLLVVSWVLFFFYCWFACLLEIRSGSHSVSPTGLKLFP